MKDRQSRGLGHRMKGMEVSFGLCLSYNVGGFFAVKLLLSFALNWWPIDKATIRSLQMEDIVTVGNCKRS